MDLNAIREVRRPASADQIENWGPGFAWLAGTCLFSELQLGTNTLIDLEGFHWPALTALAGLGSQPAAKPFKETRMAIT
jgi:hypothetical protein